jgi:hypothetical protein
MIDWNVGVDLFSALVSLASVVVAYLAVRESRKTALATTIFNSRQTWINELRHEVMNALAIIDYLPHAYANGSISTDDAIKIEHKKLIEKNKAIRLLINKSERKHRNLIRYIAYTEILIVEWINAQNIFLYHNNMPPVNHSTLQKMNKNLKRAERCIVKLSDEIFKEEWERVKKGN